MLALSVLDQTPVAGGSTGSQALHRRRHRGRASVVVTIVHDHAARRRSYELVAEAFDLAAADADGPVSLPRAEPAAL
jgi:hypothetical protein